ncbi:dynein axonemal assembly factor 4 [Centroberyx affinis]|uniref:dynein axonemal assembly factor 4 n=1 Tax=Centroberyx affinis TaxID=166261 RepID=UPI003A5BD2B3
MPLMVKDYTWTQTESTVYINVPLKGAKAGKVDILSTDEYLKVHFPPFLFEAFLSEPINDDKSSAKIGNGVAVITLPKRTSKLWEHLMIINNDKEKRKEIRERALLKYQEKTAVESKAKAAKKQEEKKYALEKMMKLEQEERDAIQKMKDDEREKSTAELEAWKLKQTQQAEEEAQLKLRHQRADQEKSKAVKKTHVDGCVGPRGGDGASREKKQVDLPAPRSAGNIQISFTPRVFPTALRESRVPEEEEWLKKQAEARRAVNADLEELKDLKEEERNPDWLKEKGDKCFATGNYLGAVNAYSLAIKLNRKIPALYSNRAACHLKLRNLHKAIEDSSQALDLLTPPVAANASARARAHVRRGSALCELQLYTEGLQDYQAALMIDPQNEGLQADAHRIRQIIQGSATDPDKE